VELELARTPSADKLAKMLDLLSLKNSSVGIDNDIEQRAQMLEMMGFGIYDALHIACGEKARADILLTTDDRLLKRASRYNQQIEISIKKPVDWLREAL